MANQTGLAKKEAEEAAGNFVPRAEVDFFLPADGIRAGKWYPSCFGLNPKRKHRDDAEGSLMRSTHRNPFPKMIRLLPKPALSSSSFKAASHVPIAVSVALASRFGVDVLSGLRVYNETNRMNWAILPMEATQPADRVQLQRVGARGMVAQLLSAKSLAVVRSVRIPTVNLSNTLQETGLPTVVCDDQEVGSMAGTYLASKGFRSFAYWGPRGNATSAYREAGFKAALGKRAQSFHVWNDPIVLAEYYRRPEHYAEFTAWLDGLPKPAGLFCFSDSEANAVQVIGRLRGIAIPAELSVLGVNNSFSNQQGGNMSLSSVALNGYEVGLRAARMLATEMAGAEAPRKPVERVAPLRIVQGLSTDTCACDNPIVVEAMKLVERNACSGMSVEDLVREMRISRRVLELHFQRTLHTSPHAEIMRVRLARAKELLVGTTLKLEVVGRLCGLADGRHLSIIFKKKLGCNPSDFRSAAAPRGCATRCG